MDEKMTQEAPSQPQLTKVNSDVPPQQSIEWFWKRFATKHPGKPFTILPDNLYAKRATIRADRKVEPAKNAVASYDQAAATCRAKVEKIARDCRRLNQKYKDPHFDIEYHHQIWQRLQRSDMNYLQDCLVSLGDDGSQLCPGSVKRVEVR